MPLDYGIARLDAPHLTALLASDVVLARQPSRCLFQIDANAAPQYVVADVPGASFPPSQLNPLAPLCLPAPNECTCSNGTEVRRQQQWDAISRSGAFVHPQPVGEDTGQETRETPTPQCRQDGFPQPVPWVAPSAQSAEEKGQKARLQGQSLVLVKRLGRLLLL